MDRQNNFLYDGEREVFVDLTYDSGFKAVFADESNKRLLIGLLNNVLPSEAHVSDIKRYLDREQGRDTLDGKRAQFDLVCEGPSGERFLVEFQRNREAAFFQRCVYYASGTYHIKLKESEQYAKLKPVYSIGFLNYRLQHENPELWDADNIVSEYVFTEKRTGELAPPSISIIFAELGRFTKTEDECVTDRDRLFYLFRHSASLTDIPDKFRELPFFKDLLEACRIAAFPEEKKLKYERSMMLERDIIAQRDFAVEEALATGREEGARKNSEDAAVKLFAAGVSVETISSCLGLAPDEIRRLVSKN